MILLRARNFASRAAFADGRKHREIMTRSGLRHRLPYMAMPKRRFGRCVFSRASAGTLHVSAVSVSAVLARGEGAAAGWLNVFRRFWERYSRS